jgi:hypothetical protein
MEERDDDRTAVIMVILGCFLVLWKKCGTVVVGQGYTGGMNLGRAQKLMSLITPTGIFQSRTRKRMMKMCEDCEIPGSFAGGYHCYGNDFTVYFY